MAKAKENSKLKKPENGFIPRIVVYACNWCSYAGADGAGTNRIQYSPHFRIIRVMCSGRVTPAFVLKAFELGADGVIVSGCHFGDCHYIFGNHKAVEWFDVTKNIIHTLGLEPERIRLEWVSAAEGPKWAQLINEFTETITNLGRSPLAHDDRLNMLKIRQREMSHREACLKSKDALMDDKSDELVIEES
ncbi:hydrogenase iron-sulfur subunit, partial [bacterium]|nr:hydrogenase iron-sulfur subunit [bacterium]MBU1025013.1 hydrogenase iron-sulfur subunit [bacterium]